MKKYGFVAAAALAILMSASAFSQDRKAFCASNKATNENLYGLLAGLADKIDAIDATSWQRMPPGTFREHSKALSQGQADTVAALRRTAEAAKQLIADMDRCDF